MKERLVIEIATVGADSGTIVEAIEALRSTAECREITRVVLKYVTLDGKEEETDVTFMTEGR